MSWIEWEWATLFSHTQLMHIDSQTSMLMECEPLKSCGEAFPLPIDSFWSFWFNWFLFQLICSTTNWLFVKTLSLNFRIGWECQNFQSWRTPSSCFLCIAQHMTIYNILYYYYYCFLICSNYIINKYVLSFFVILTNYTKSLDTLF